jgi:Holliday junction resolvasome RuvABC endonuclease subunit
VTTCLGIDPGPAHLAWAHLDVRTLLDRGELIAAQNVPWARQRARYREQLAHLLHEKHPGLVAIETVNAFPGRNRTPGQIAGQAVQTSRTQEIIADVRVLCAERDIAVVELTPRETLAGLGLAPGRKHTDAQQANAAQRLLEDAVTDRKWRGKEEGHMARAAGAALRGPQKWLLQAATAGQGRLAV